MADSNAYGTSGPRGEYTLGMESLIATNPRFREVLDESDQLARAGERVGYESAYRVLRRGILEVLQLECPGCHPSGGDRYRDGEDIRQKPNGDLVCIACGRVTSEATDVR